MVHAILAVVLFVLVLALVIWQPRGLSIGWPAAIGGALAVTLGIVTWADVLAVVRIVWDATITFVAVILISLVLDAVGFFEWAALHMVRAARGRGQRLFVLSLLLGALVAALFANDGAALILTPIVYEQVKALRLDSRAILAFVMAGGFIADATSLPFIVSNLVNIVSADFFRIGFLGYSVRMLPVDVVACGASIAALWLFYGRQVPVRVPMDTGRPPNAAIRDPQLFRWSWVVLGLLLAGYVVSQFVHMPVSIVAGGADLVFLAAAMRSPAVRVGRLLREAPWRIVVFSIGMYVVVFGLRDAGLVAAVGASIRWAVAHGRSVGVLYTGYLAAFLSSVMNNMPTVMVNALAIQSIHAGGLIRTALALANVVGSDLGPKLTPIGSLATLLWLHVLEGRGVKISWGYYVRVGFALTLPVLLVTLCGLLCVVAVEGR